jgi:hypothetical protein
VGGRLLQPEAQVLLNARRQREVQESPPGNLVDDKEWEADNYDLKRRYFSTLDADEKSKKVRPGNLLDDEEWEAEYYDLKRRYFSTLDANKKSVPAAPPPPPLRGRMEKVGLSSSQ